MLDLEKRCADARQRVAERVERVALYHSQLTHLLFTEQQQAMNRRHDRWLAEVRNNRILGR